MSSKVVISPLPDIEIPLICISKFLLNRMRLFGDKVFIIEYTTDKCYKFNQLADDCLRMANIWIDLGLQPNEIFGICGDNCYEYIVCMLSGIFIGGIAVPIRGSDTMGEVTKVINERGINRLAISGDRLQLLAKTQTYEKLKGLVFGESEGFENYNHFLLYENLINESKLLSEEDLFDPKDVKESVCLILESSGTTGPPKGCMFSHYNLISLITIGSLPQLYNRTSDDIVSGHSTMAHISGINQLIMSLANGSKLILHLKFDYNNFFAAIEKHKITALSAASSVFIKLFKSGTNYDISSLKNVICGSASLPNGYGWKIVEKYPHLEDFRQGYGMTEMTILIAFEMYGSKHYDSCGQPTPANKIKVIDINTGELLSHDCVGEICVTGPTLFKGYHNNLIATKETIDCDNYLHSGDLGYYDKEGHFYIVDRIKSLLKTDGMQVSPTELEGIFLTHDSVEEVAVIGMADEVLGEIATAVVVVKEQYKYTLTSDDLLKFVNDRITAQKRIRGGVHLMECLPKNSLGKVARRELKQLLLNKIEK